MLKLVSANNTLPKICNYLQIVIYMTYCYIHICITCVPVGLYLLVLLHSMMKDDLLLTLMFAVAITVQGKPPCQHVYVCIGVIMNKSD